MFDLGVYIAITSVNPLRLYYFDDILFRSCADEFVENLKSAPQSSYVVSDDYMPPWGLPSFREFYTWGMSTLNVVRAFFHSKGTCLSNCLFSYCKVDVDFYEVFMIMKADILELMASYANKLESASFKYPHGQESFYALYRVDFILDRNLKPWITEVRRCSLYVL